MQSDVTIEGGAENEAPEWLNRISLGRVCDEIDGHCRVRSFIRSVAIFVAGIGCRVFANLWLPDLRHSSTALIGLSPIALLCASNVSHANQEWWSCKAFMKDGYLIQTLVYVYDDQRNGLYWYLPPDERLEYTPGWEISDEAFVI